jgi:hypothetical protein
MCDTGAGKAHAVQTPVEPRDVVRLGGDTADQVRWLVPLLEHRQPDRFRVGQRVVWNLSLLATYAPEFCSAL